MPVVPFQDLAIVDEPWIPEGKTRVEIESEILDGDNWDRYRRAHLWYDAQNRKVKAGYKLPIARMVDGELKACAPQIAAAVSVLNGGRGGVAIPSFDRRRSFNHALRYYEKQGIPREEWPERRTAEKPKEAAGSLLRLEDVSVDEDDSPKWVQVAVEGEYRGYANGDMPFTLTRELFEKFIDNFRAHPSYSQGPDGWGCAEILPWDFNHASEQAPVAGDLPVRGAPSQGWTYDLDIRETEDGRCALWSLTQFLEPARSYVRAKQYRWASISFYLNAIDPVSGAAIGPLITSIALTNQPFIEGMERLVASRPGIDDAASAAPVEDEQPLKRTGGDEMALVKTLSAALGVAENDSAVTRAVDELVGTKKTLASKLGADEASDRILLQTAEELMGAKEKLAALLQAVGVENPEDAVIRVAELMAQAEKLKALMPELEQLKEEMMAIEETAIVDDVEEVMASRQLPEEVREALLVLRRSSPSKFGEKFPKMQQDKTPLLQSLTRGEPRVAGEGNEASPEIDLGLYPGRNTTERAMAYLTKNHSGEWDRQELWKAACLLKRRDGVVDSLVGGRN